MMKMKRMSLQFVVEFDFYSLNQPAELVAVALMMTMMRLSTSSSLLARCFAFYCLHYCWNYCPRFDCGGDDVSHVDSCDDHPTLKVHHANSPTDFD